jgi:5-methylcytosine-specific restriction endonuclease McrA
MAHVLLLNASYEPLRTISVRKAIHLLLAEKVHGVEGIAQKLRTTSRVFEVPSVVRLAYYVNVPRRGLNWSRRGVLNRDGWRCVYCGTAMGERKKGKVTTKADFTLDHIRPRSRGGRNTWGNTACACAPCNHRKGNRMPHEAGMKLLFEPKTPRTNTLVIKGPVTGEWKKYLEFTS